MLAGFVEDVSEENRFVDAELLCEVFEEAAVLDVEF